MEGGREGGIEGGKVRRPLLKCRKLHPSRSLPPVLPPSLVNSIYERYLPRGCLKPSPDATHEEREMWVRAKYEHKVRRPPSLSPSLPRSPLFPFPFFLSPSLPVCILFRNIWVILPSLPPFRPSSCPCLQPKKGYGPKPGKKAEAVASDSPWGDRHLLER